jgi:hypothetical protein
MLAQPLAFSLIVHHDCSSRSQAFIHARAGEHFAFIAAPHSIEKRLRVLRSSMLPCSRTPCAHRRSFLQQPCAHHRFCLQQPCAHSSCTHHPSSSSLILSSIVRSSTLELENVLRSSLLVHAHARERLACVLRSSTLSLRSLARERLALIVALACNSLELTHRPSSSLMPMKHRALISMLMLENVSRSSSHMLATALHSPFIYRSSRWLSLASVLRSPRSNSRTSCVRRCSLLLMC